MSAQARDASVVDGSEQCGREPRCETSLPVIRVGVQDLPNRTAVVEGADELNPQIRDKIADIESASRAGSWLKKTCALIAHHRSGVTAPCTSTSQDQVQDSARERMHASRLRSSRLTVKRTTVHVDVGTVRCGRAVTCGLLLPGRQAHKTCLEGYDESGRTRCGSERIQDRSNVILDGVLGNPQRLSDLTVRVSAGDERQDAGLSGGQRAEVSRLRIVGYRIGEPGVRGPLFTVPSVSVWQGVNPKPPTVDDGAERWIQWSRPGDH